MNASDLPAMGAPEIVSGLLRMQAAGFEFTGPERARLHQFRAQFHDGADDVGGTRAELERLARQVLRRSA